MHRHNNKDDQKFNKNIKDKITKFNSLNNSKAFILPLKIDYI